jgi:hypothetical protein
VSKRFGRNQRRKLRDLIAGLEHKLFSDYERATGRFPDVTRLVGPVLESEVTDYKRAREQGREATLLVYATQGAHKLHELFAEQRNPFVEHDGYVWRLTNVTVEDRYLDCGSIYGGSRYDYVGGPPSVTLKLLAEPARNPR